MIKRYSLLFLLTLPLLIVGCKDDDPVVAPIDQLPPATQTGEYTFGCLVNGKAFVPKTTMDVGAIYQQKILVIYGQLISQVGEQEIRMNLFSSIKGGRRYDLANEPYEVAEFDWYGVNIPTCNYSKENTLSGTLTITHFDNVEYIISGTFEFVTATEGCDTVRVTDGRFDIPYIP